jgi:hypothetical protein
LLTLPVLAVTAATAVLFETIPALRAGLGNIAWFLLWMIFAIAGQGAPLGGLGTVATTMREAVAAQYLPPPRRVQLGIHQSRPSPAHIHLDRVAPGQRILEKTTRT